MHPPTLHAKYCTHLMREHFETLLLEVFRNVLLAVMTEAFLPQILLAVYIPLEFESRIGFLCRTGLL